MKLIEWCEHGWISDSLVRSGIRRLCGRRLADEGLGNEMLADARFRQLLQELRHSAVAIETAAANEQHYELPTRFFQLCLGKRLKYSSCLYPLGDESEPLVGQPRRQCIAGDVRPGGDLRKRVGRPMEPAVAVVLDGLRGTVRLSERQPVDGCALSLHQALNPGARPGFRVAPG